VTKGDWQEQLDPAVRADLRKHRTYKGKSVRDLLRAIRNKKHHYRELTEEAKLLYGKMPGEFTDYWTRRFPRLLSHSYNAMQCVKYENNFTKYYHKDYDYVPPPEENILDEMKKLFGSEDPMARVRPDGIVVTRSDLSQADADIFSPKFLETQTAPKQQEFKATEQPDSIVSTWSQLDSGTNSRLEDLCVAEPMHLCERDPDSSPAGEGGGDSDQLAGDVVNPAPVDNRLLADNDLEEKNLCDNEEIESTPCDKENLNPVIVEECEPKKKNKKRRKHQKKTRLETPGVEEDT